MPTRTLYDVLGVSRDATIGEIKRAFRRLALVNHPDRAGENPTAADRFRRALEAYDVLSDKEKRERYDETIAPPETVVDLFVRHARGNRIAQSMLPTAPAEPKPGVHLARVVEPFENAAPWTRLAEQGDAGVNGAPNGDLFLMVKPAKP